MKIKEPKLKKELSKDTNYAIQNKEYTNTYFEELPITKINDVIFDGCTFKKIDFSKIDLSDVAITDCIFDSCDISNKCFDKMFITRCKFINTKMVGTSFIGANLKDVKFISIKGDYLNFSNSKLNNILFEETNLSYSYFSESQMKSVYFDKTNLTNAMFYKVNHDNLDLSTSTLNGIIIDSNFLKDITINMFQAADLISFFGVKVKGEYGDS